MKGTSAALTDLAQLGDKVDDAQLEALGRKIAAMPEKDVAAVIAAAGT